jgi:F-type H+-transporting ATPase subunit delta
MPRKASVASARRYAEAVFDIALEQESLAQWGADLHGIAGFVSEPDVAAVLGNGRVPRDQKLVLLAAGLERELSPQAWNLVRLLEDRGRLALAPEILEVFQEKLDEHRGIAKANVTTAVPLSEDEERAIAARLSQITGKQVEVQTNIDESILGGVVARVGDQLIDGSTRTRLLELKRSLAGARR